MVKKIIIDNITLLSRIECLKLDLYHAFLKLPKEKQKRIIDEIKLEKQAWEEAERCSNGIFDTPEIRYPAIKRRLKSLQELKEYERENNKKNNSSI